MFSILTLARVVWVDFRSARVKRHRFGGHWFNAVKIGIICETSKYLGHNYA